MSTSAVNQNMPQTSTVEAGADTQELSPLAQVFSEGSVSDPSKAKSLAQDILDLNSQSPFLSEEQVEKLQAIVDELDAGSIGEQMMALDRLAGVLIEICPSDLGGTGVDLSDLEALDQKVSPLADGYRSFLDSVLNQSSPADQLNALQEFASQLGSLESADASQLGLSDADIQTFEAEVHRLVNSYKSLLNTESASQVSSSKSWANFVGEVQDLKSSLEEMGLNLEGSEIDSFLSQYGSSESIDQTAGLDLLEQRSIVVSFRSDLLDELDGADLSATFVPQGVNKAREQVSVEENIYAVGEAMKQDEYRSYLTDAKSVLMGDGGSLAGASAEDFQLYKSNLNSMAERRCAELGIPSNPEHRTEAQQQLADSDILLAMIDGSIAWADKWEAEAGDGTLTKREAFSASIELIALDADMFKKIQNHVAKTHGTDSEIYMMVTEWFETASQVLLKLDRLMKMAANY